MTGEPGGPRPSPPPGSLRARGVAEPSCALLALLPLQLRQEGKLEVLQTQSGERVSGAGDPERLTGVPESADPRPALVIQGGSWGSRRAQTLGQHW